MAPIRRYLRITKYSVLECRIYLDNPALVQSWLLNPRDPVLPRVIEAVRPLVLPKLREEQERERSNKKNKKRSIKDVVVQGRSVSQLTTWVRRLLSHYFADDFEVAIFLTETDVRHSILHKTKLLRDKVQTRLTSNSLRLVGASRETPVDVDAADLPGAGDDAPVPVLREEDEDVNLADIPMIEEGGGSPGPGPKRRRRPRGLGQGPNDGDSDVEELETDSSVEYLGDDGEESDDSAAPRHPQKRRKDQPTAAGAGAVGEGKNGPRDDKKKMAFDISYEGFAIYGRVLCLVVKRRGVGSNLAGGPPGAAQTGRPGGQAMMENWIASTQMPPEDDAAVGGNEDDGA
jgi:hypothetical protein